MVQLRPVQQVRYGGALTISLIQERSMLVLKLCDKIDPEKVTDTPGYVLCISKEWIALSNLFVIVNLSVCELNCSSDISIVHSYCVFSAYHELSFYERPWVRQLGPRRSYHGHRRRIR